MRPGVCCIPLRFCMDEEEDDDDDDIRYKI